MCEALRLLMRDELEESKELGIKQGIEQGIERGIEQGIEQGRLYEIISSVRDGDYSRERGAEKLGISVEKFEEYLL